MKTSIRTLVYPLCIAVSYPFLLPFCAAYVLTKNERFLDQMLSFRSIPTRVPMRHGLRLARYDGMTLFFPYTEDSFFNDVFLRDVYYPYKPCNTDVVFDIGAHMGFFTIKVAKQVRKVFAFEPDLYNFKFLSWNVTINKLSNVQAFNYALGDRNTIMFLDRKYGYGRTRVTEKVTNCKALVKTLDTVTSELGIAPNVIKIDTEGYEVKVLKGAKSTLDHHGSKLLVASYHYPNELSDVVKFLDRSGFRCFVYRVPLTLPISYETYVYAEPK